jgi:hypothetical protein
MKQYIPTNQTHELVTVNDFAKVVTPQNIDLLVADFRMVLEGHLVMQRLADMSAELMGHASSPIELPKFTWIDDGKHDYNGITLSSPEGALIEFTEAQFKAIKKNLFPDLNP